MCSGIGIGKSSQKKKLEAEDEVPKQRTWEKQAYGKFGTLNMVNHNYKIKQAAKQDLCSDMISCLRRDPRIEC